MKQPPPGEGCEDPTGVTGIEQAHGILSIHEACRPPCKRRQAAVLFLAHVDAEAKAPPPTS